MRQRLLRQLSISFLAAAVALSVCTEAQPKTLSSQQSDAGHVMVTVTPVMVSETADTWRFDVRLNTHVAPITQDIAAVSVLDDGDGHSERPSAWEGDPPGGHHRKGTLVFRPFSPMPGSITLHIREVGDVPDRSFTWNMKRP